MVEDNKSLTLYLIRHGQSYMNADHTDLIGGRSPETPLSSTGKEQARLLGEYFKQKDISFNYLHSSTLIRAKETTDIFNDQLGHPKMIKYWDELIEFTQGDWEKKLRRGVYTSEQCNIINQQEIFFTPPNGESKSMVTLRVAQWFQNEIFGKMKQSETHVVVCHGLVIKCFLYYILGFHDSLIHKIEIDNTSISKLTFKKSGWHLNYINRIDHLI